MKRCWSTDHCLAICLALLFALLITRSVQADFLEYFKLKKLLTAAVVAKALTHRRPKIIPVPIPIPIPIQQNEIISLPSSVAKKMFISGSGHQKHQRNKPIILDGGHFGNVRSSLYGSSTYGYPLSDKGHFNRGSADKGFLSLSKLASLAGLSNANSVKIINMDSLTSNHKFANQYPFDGSNIIGGKFFSNTHSQFPIGGNAGRLPMADTQFYTNNEPILGLHTNGYLSSYNPYTKKNRYPQNIQNPRKRRRKYPRKKSFYRKPVTQQTNHMNPTGSQNFPPQTKRPSSLPEMEATLTVEVGDKVRHTPYTSHQ